MNNSVPKMSQLSALPDEDNPVVRGLGLGLHEASYIVEIEPVWPGPVGKLAPPLSTVTGQSDAGLPIRPGRLLVAEVIQVLPTGHPREYFAARASHHVLRPGGAQHPTLRILTRVSRSAR